MSTCEKLLNPLECFWCYVMINYSIFSHTHPAQLHVHQLVLPRLMNCVNLH